MISLDKITYSVPVKDGESRNTVLDSVSLDIQSGKYTVITGPNGGGKTSIARIIMGIYKPDSGRVLLDGADITDKTITERSKMGLGFGFQHPPRFKGLSVKDLLSIAAGKKLNHYEICQLLTAVGLCASDYIKREVDSSLSGGELKRIEIASVLATESRIMIFDEPEAGIDLWSFKKLTETFKLYHENGLTFSKENEDCSNKCDSCPNMKEKKELTENTLIIISHQERIIEQADEVILIADGKVAGRGSPEEILPNIGSYSRKYNLSCGMGER